MCIARDTRSVLNVKSVSTNFVSHFIRGLILHAYFTVRNVYTDTQYGRSFLTYAFRNSVSVTKRSTRAPTEMKNTERGFARICDDERVRRALVIAYIRGDRDACKNKGHWKRGFDIVIAVCISLMLLGSKRTRKESEYFFYENSLTTRFEYEEDSRGIKQHLSVHFSNGFSHDWSVSH